MPELYTANQKDVENRSLSQPIILKGGVDQETSKFAVAPGTLFDCLNYTAGPNGYERMMGLRLYDGTYDQPVVNCTVVGVDDNESTLTGTEFTLGGQATWGTGNSGTVVYYSRTTSTTPDYTLLYITDITGDIPAAGDTITDVESGTTLVLNNPLTHDPAALVDAVHPFLGTNLASTISDFVDEIDRVNLTLSNRTDIETYSTISTYHGEVPGWGPINGGWQFNDEVYVARNAYYFRADALTRVLDPNERIQVVFADATTEWATMLGYEYVEDFGTGENVVIWLGPHFATTDYRLLGDSSNLIASLKDDSGNTVATAVTAGGTDPITKSLVWKATVHGWEFVNTGWTAPFVTGTNAPNVMAAPLFQQDLVDASRATDVHSAASAQNLATHYPSGTAWTSLSNITTDNNAYVSATLAASASAGDESQALIVSFENPTNEYLVPGTDSRIVGVEVTVKAKKSGAAGSFYARDLEVRLVSLLGSAPDGELVMSKNRAGYFDLGSTEAEFIYGGSTDLWGLDKLTAAEINSEDLHVMLRYESVSTAACTVEIDYVSIKFYYVPNNERIYTQGHTTTGGEYGTLIAYQQFGGEFSIDTAYGEMSFSYLSHPQYLAAGSSMTTEGFAGGLFIAEFQGIPEYNFLPGSVAMAAEQSKYQTVFANFYENDETAAIYGVTGAGPAFTYSSSGFAFIRTPLDKSVDKPRHIAFHDNRLALGFGPGFVALSAVGVPNDFTGITGADPSLWGVGDTLTGMLSVPGNVLAVFSESSIRTLEGSGEQSGNMRVISANSGAKEYTAVLVGEPVFVDNRGVSSLSTTDKYGDFDLGRLTDPIRSWIQARIQNAPVSTSSDNGVVLAVPIRNKSQYRLFFEDGYGLTLFFNSEGGVEPTFFHYETHTDGADAAAEPTSRRFVPTWADSSVLSSGRERVVIGNSEGAVFVVDGSVNTYLPESNAQHHQPHWLIFNPINLSGSEVLGKSYYVTLQGLYWGYLPISAWSDTNYYFDKAGNATADAGVLAGALTDTPLFKTRPFLVRPYLPTLTDGLVIKVGTNVVGSWGGVDYAGHDKLSPHVFQSIILRASSKAVNRNRASKEY